MTAELAYGAVLRGSEADLRYPLGTVQPLGDLLKEFSFSQNHQRKVTELIQRGYKYLRRVRGDGNCFYRAVGFAWLEALATRAARGRAATGLFIDWPSASRFGDLAREYQELQQTVAALMQQGLPEKQAAENGQRVIARLLGDVRFDLCVTVFVRLLVASFLESSPQDSHHSTAKQEDRQMLTTMVAVQYGSVEQFLQAEVLPLGQEAEGVAIAIAARQLNMWMRILQLDSSPGSIPDYVYPSEDYESPLGIRICLLFRPGHYELLYHSETPRLREPPTFLGRCSFCRESAQLPGDRLLVCFHRLCPSCSPQARQESNTTICPICTDTAPAQLPRTEISMSQQGQASHRPSDEAFAVPCPAPPPTEASLSRYARSTMPAALSSATHPSRAATGLLNSSVPTQSSADRSDTLLAYNGHDPATLPEPRGNPSADFFASAPNPVRTFGVSEDGLRAPPKTTAGHTSAAQRSANSRASGGGADSAGYMRLPQTEKDLKRNMALTAGRMPQPMSMRPSPTSNAIASQAKSEAHCCSCSSTENLRRVRCCNMHFCLKCLSEEINTACSRRGMNMSCKNCGTDWDLWKLAKACNVEVPVDRPPATSASEYAAVAGTAGSVHLGGAAVGR